MNPIYLCFNIRPFPKERPRFTKKGYSYTPKKTRAFENYIAVNAKKQLVENGIYKPTQKLLSVKVFFFFKKPKKTILEIPKPDLDNLLKSLFDSLNKLVYVDDTQIRLIYAIKNWSTQDQIVVTFNEAINTED